jgi:hypothetical protein
VVVDRPRRDYEALRDLGVGDAGTKHPEDLDLTVCKTSGIGVATERPPAHEGSGWLRTQIEKQLQRFESGHRFA